MSGPRKAWMYVGDEPLDMIVVGGLTAGRTRDGEIYLGIAVPKIDGEGNPRPPEEWEYLRFVLPDPAMAPSLHQTLTGLLAEQS